MKGTSAGAAVALTPRPPRIVLLTTFDLDGYVLGGLRAGASGFLLKHAPPEEILLSIRAAAAIARRLGIGDNTAKTHVTRILGKLGLRDRAHAVVYGYETGLVRPGDAALLPEGEGA